MVGMFLDRPEPSPGGLRTAIQRRALRERTAERFDDRTELRLVKLLAVARARGAGDVLVHQGAAEIVGACLQYLTRAGDAALHPRRLHVRDRVAVGDPTD